MNKLLLGWLAAALLPVLAAAQQMAGPPATTPNAVMSPTISTELSAQDRMFIDKATTSGIAEVNDGQLAEHQGDPAIKQIGSMMVKDHSTANEKLASLATEVGYAAPKTVTTKQAAMTTSLQSLSGRAFDQAYLKDQLHAHQKAIALFKKETLMGTNVSLKQFADATLPILEHHLAMVQAAMAAH